MLGFTRIRGLRGNTDVVDAFAVTREKVQVARLSLVGRDRLGGVGLIVCVTWQLDTEHAVGEVNQAGAVEAVSGQTTPHVWHVQ